MQIGSRRDRDMSSDEEMAPTSCNMDTTCERSADAVKFDSSRGIYPESIVWTWLPGCTQCTAGLVGHMGITNSHGEVFEFVGTGADKNHPGQLAFGPIIRYVPLPSKLVRRGTCDEGIARAIEKYQNLSCHPFNNCHCFVAACLDEMRFLGFPCWGCFWWVLALMVWVCGLFPARWSTGVCLLSTVVLSGAVLGVVAFTGSGFMRKGYQTRLASHDVFTVIQRRESADAGMLYWVSEGTQMLHRAALDGSGGVEDLAPAAEGLAVPYYLSVGYYAELEEYKLHNFHDHFCGESVHHAHINKCRQHVNFLDDADRTDFDHAFDHRYDLVLEYVHNYEFENQCGHEHNIEFFVQHNNYKLERCASNPHLKETGFILPLAPVSALEEDSFVTAAVVAVTSGVVSLSVFVAGVVILKKLGMVQPSAQLGASLCKRLAPSAANGLPTRNIFRRWRKRSTLVEEIPGKTDLGQDPSKGTEDEQAETPRSNKPDSDVKEGSLRSVAKRPSNGEMQVPETPVDMEE
ncbi:Tmem222, partial [Symbiodinium microadriaticum]